uniref:DNA-directed RNA polymerase subunit beta'' n=1 Tax=Porphyridium purpureum TaxID=35688 RepID=W0RYX0_PORPP|nr:plastid-encoded DNA-directed RNA polymerase subunit beta'' [Porphyridium purpureum]BAO23781.1 plastid-encoded DNA-directed RNA polymerase subunit beta'' [Porphyridium purpureum]
MNRNPIDKNNDLVFLNKVLDKKQLKNLILWVFRNYGVARATSIADQLKTLGFFFATQAGISLSIEDLRIPPKKRGLLQSTSEIINSTELRYSRGDITIVERFQKVIDTWNNASETLKQEVIEYFKETDPLNPVYMMAFSGARGNISQVRQLVGMRGLMADPQGQIIDLPISSNFREGLNVTEYFISSYGARKGLVDTALRTADSGYLTRRLVDVAQDVIIRELDCHTKRGIVIESMVDNDKILISLMQSIVGRTLAEDIYSSENRNIIAKSTQVIDITLAKKIIEANLDKVLVRSPLTCESHGSICQTCYGWNLAHGKKVDLGEAVGIIAAQSIGEPGTQLTMRTFHTGGVFTGELANQIFAPISGKVSIANKAVISSMRTTHGDQAFIVGAPFDLEIVGISNRIKLRLNKNDILFFEDSSYIDKGMILAESPKSKRVITEEGQRYLMTDLSGEVYLDNISTEESLKNKKETLTRIVEQQGIIWVLSGQVYNIPDTATLTINTKEKIYKGDTLAKIELVNKFSGYAKIDKDIFLKDKINISIVCDLVKYKDIQVISQQDLNLKNYKLKVLNSYDFILNVQPNDTIFNGQPIAKMISEEYKTHTGGIIKFLNLNISKSRIGINKDAYEIYNPGYILWISEETHTVHKVKSMVFVNSGEFIEEGTEIVNNVFCRTSGIVELIFKDDIVKEIIIKPGKIYIYKGILDRKEKRRGFLRPGENLNNQLITDKLVYWEYVELETQAYILIRSVQVYSITEKLFLLSKELNKNLSASLDLYSLIKTRFQDGERIKSIEGVELLTVELLPRIDNNDKALTNKIDISQDTVDGLSYLILSCSESLSIDAINNNMDNQGNNTSTAILIDNNQFIRENTVIAQTQVLAKQDGFIQNIPKKFVEDRRIILIADTDIKTILLDSPSELKEGSWIRAGDSININIKSPYSGKVMQITENAISIRLGHPYLISKSSILYVSESNLVQQGETLAVLIFRKSKTGDIIQGLPRIEEILEARKKRDSSLFPHELLTQYFNFYSTKGLNLYDAARLSLQDIQQILLNEIQLVYQSQGVDIADKHIEVIVRQMTKKVQIENGGDSKYLPNEIVDLYTIENINRNLELQGKRLANYFPVLMGITKASLNTDSFISAASFQETTKVLAEAAIAGKLDWLKGLKENVIIGRLIPAGTGLDLDSNFY